jgi:hypothetical protein
MKRGRAAWLLNGQIQHSGVTPMTTEPASNAWKYLLALAVLAALMALYLIVLA